MSISSQDVKAFIEWTFDSNRPFYESVAFQMGNNNPTFPDLNKDQTYHPKRIFKVSINPKNIKSDKYGIFNENTISIFANGHREEMELSNVECVRGFNICVLSYDFVVLVIEDKMRNLFFGKVMKYSR